MQVKDVNIHTRHTVSVALENSDERLDVQYGQGEFRPDSVNLTWTRNDEDWTLTGATVSGPKVKKDGSDSLNRGKRSFAGFRRMEPMPGWLQGMIQTYETTLPVTR